MPKNIDKEIDRIIQTGFNPYDTAIRKYNRRMTIICYLLGIFVGILITFTIIYNSGIKSDIKFDNFKKTEIINEEKTI